jgi:hypothetical protein
LVSTPRERVAGAECRSNTLTRMRVLAVAMCAVALAACSNGKGSSSNASPTTRSGKQITGDQRSDEEVVITSCAPNGLHNVEIKGSVKNATSRAVSYTIQLAIADGSGRRRYATAASARDVPPKNAAVWDAQTTAPYASGMSCTVTTVSRA